MTPPAIDTGIRRARLTDAPSITDIHVRAWQTVYRGMMPDDYLAAQQADQRYARWKHDIDAPDDTMAVFVPEEAETGEGSRRLPGFCSVCPQKDMAPGDDLLDPNGELHTIYVDVMFKEKISCAIWDSNARSCGCLPAISPLAASTSGWAGRSMAQPHSSGTAIVRF
jgi:hypothetical protein